MSYRINLGALSAEWDKEPKPKFNMVIGKKYAYPLGSAVTLVKVSEIPGCNTYSLEGVQACYIEMNGKTFYLDDSTGEGIAECHENGGAG